MVNSLRGEELKLLETLGYSNTLDLREFFESRLMDWNEGYSNNANTVDDTLYTAIKILYKRIFPESDLNLNWDSKDSLDYAKDALYNSLPFKSISTIKSKDQVEYKNFINSIDNRVSASGKSVDLFASLKLDGHGIRVRYKNGELVLATSRGRSKSYVDITRQLRVLLGESNDNLKHYDEVEIRGELAVSYPNFERALMVNSQLKSPFFAVSSLIRPSSTDYELSLLSFYGYKVISNDLSFDTLSEEFEFIEQIGFDVPLNISFTVDPDENADDVLDKVLAHFGRECDNGYPLFTDGIVVNLDSNLEFKALGEDSSVRYGNIALKTGRWKQEIYTAQVLKVILERGKGKKAPVALIEKTLTTSGAHVTRVPLYNLANLVKLKAYEGNYISFMFGSAGGVVPCGIDGTLVKDIESIAEFVLKDMQISND